MIIVTGQTVKLHYLKNFIMTILIQRKLCSTSNIPTLKIFWFQYSTAVYLKTHFIQLFPTH